MAKDEVSVGKGTADYGKAKAVWDIKPGTKYKRTQYKKGGNQVQDYLSNFMTDRQRDWLNFTGDWGIGGNVWANRPMTPGGGYGDATFGANPSEYFPKVDPNKPKPETKTDKSKDRSMQEILDEMMGLLGGGGAGYGPLRQELSSQRDRNDARLSSMYREVADYINGLRPQTEETYSKAAEGYNTAQQQAANAVNMGVDISRQQQANMLKALGIEEAANVASARGEDMGTNQTAALNRFADILNTNLNRNTGAQTGALMGLQNLSTATIGEGARARQAYQEAMSQKLAELAASETQYNNQRSDQALQMAMDVMNSQSDQAPPAMSTDQMSAMYDTWFQQAKDAGRSDEDAISIANQKMNAWKASQGF
jgi:hypothetical protein